MKLKIAFSPCPNDTFMMDALVHHKLADNPFDFDVHIADVEELNERAFENMHDVTKLSYHAFLHLSDQYDLLHAGSALGHGVGPLLIALNKLTENEINEGPIGLPGKWTTAHFLFQLRHPNAQQKEFGLFSKIEKKVLDKTLRSGVIIHENRFTYADRGLICLADLGAYWESITNLPIPLGAIAVKKSLPSKVKTKLNDLLMESIEFARKNTDAVMPYVKSLAQEMDDEVMLKHIDLYVNNFSLDLGENGRDAISAMIELALEKEVIRKRFKDYFI